MRTNRYAPPAKKLGSRSNPRPPTHEIGHRKPLIISKIGRTAHDKASERWRDLARKWNVHIAKIRKNLKSDERDTSGMKVYAETAEGYGFDAIVFAQASIYEAEYAALDALAARAAAEAMASREAATSWAKPG